MQVEYSLEVGRMKQQWCLGGCWWLCVCVCVCPHGWRAAAVHIADVGVVQLCALECKSRGDMPALSLGFVFETGPRVHSLTSPIPTSCSLLITIPPPYTFPPPPTHTYTYTQTHSSHSVIPLAMPEHMVVRARGGSCHAGNSTPIRFMWVCQSEAVFTAPCFSLSLH